jgi:DNA-binding NtrC family response regulator
MECVYSVLIVEDEPMIIKMYSVMLEKEKNVSFHVISSVEQFAEDYRKGLPDFDIAIVDACLRSKEANAIPLLKQLKVHNPKAVIIAASANHNRELVAAGANQACEKFQVANHVLELIKHLN